MPSVSYPPGVAEVVPAEDAREPERWLVAACWAVVVFSVTQVLLFGFGRTHAAHALVGDALLRGEVPYVDAWDPSAPGIFLLHALLQAIFGKNMVGLRLVEAAGLLGQVLCFRWLGGVLFGSRTAGLLGGALAALLHAELEFWNTGGPEIFAGFFTVLALVVAVRSSHRLHRQAALLGLCAAGVALFEPYFAPFVVVGAAYLGRRIQTTRGTHALLFPGVTLLVSSLLPLALCAGWFASRGALGEFVGTLSTYASSSAERAWNGKGAAELFYDASAEAAIGISGLVAVGLLAACVQRPLFAREREGAFLVFGILSVQLAAVALRGEPSTHHFGAMLPLLAFLAGLGWYKLWRRLAVGGPSGYLAFASFLFVVGAMREPARDLPQGFWQRSALRTGYLLRVGPLTTREELETALMTRGDYDLAALRRTAHDLAAHLSPSATLYVAGDEPALYWLTGARPAHRFLRGIPLDPDQSDPEAALSDLLATARPSHVLLRTPSPGPRPSAVHGATPEHALPTPSASEPRGPSPAGTPEGPTTALSGYELRARASDFTLYVAATP